jgi:hypothetical protein
MSNTLSLATRLRALPDDELLRAMSERAIGVHHVKDFFDLAEAFLDRSSIQQMLTRLDRHTLAVVTAVSQLTPLTGNETASAADVAARLTSLAAKGGGGSATVTTESDVVERATRAAALLLLDVQSESDSIRFMAYDSVRIQLASWPAFGLPGLEQLADPTPPAALEPVPDVDARFVDRLGAERAFSATTAITELLVQVEREPARELAKGGVALPDTKRLANAMAIDLPSVATFIEVADRASLIARETGSWMITDDGAAWLLLSSRDRWGGLAAAWFESLPADIRTLLGNRTHALWGSGLRGYIDWLYPAGGEWMDNRVTAYTRDAEILGITANQAPSTPGSLLLQDRLSEAVAAMAALLPAEVEQVYLQHDLSVVAPGPLTPQVDARLRGVADVESRALASSYRISTSSVNRAMASGETAESILEFLGSISLTGIPQPLSYLVTEAAGRYGLVRVLPVTDPTSDADTLIRSSDDGLLGTIMVDQGLSSLGLTRIAPDTLASRYSLDVVFWSLSDARYPVAAENERGEIVELRRQRTARGTPVDTSDPQRSLIERLRLNRSAVDEDDGQAWLSRQLDLAIKARSALSVSVSMPNGNIVEYQLEPTSIAGGRLRGRDRKSAIERTLPLARITAIGPPA